MRSLAVVLLTFASLLTLAQKPKGFGFVERPTERKIDLFYNGKLITSYIFFDSLLKTAYYPLSTLSGTHITREFPYGRKTGERTDHPHHVGLFFAHQSVNGYDFWNMSTAIPPARRSRYGRQVAKGVISKKAGAKSARITTQATWATYEGEELLREVTLMKFSVDGTDLVIDRLTTLLALKDIEFKDEKDALLGLRVARELELPVEGKDRFVLPDGTTTPEPVPNDITKVTGSYRNSESLIGEAVWGKKAAWVCLDGRIDGKDISVAILDHPANIEHPAYWHARGYGLFAVNPLGNGVFSEGKARLDFKLPRDLTATFRYRIVIREGSRLTPAELNQHARQFSGWNASVSTR